MLTEGRGGRLVYGFLRGGLTRGKLLGGWAVKYAGYDSVWSETCLLGSFRRERSLLFAFA
jgi:hypothetical protein